MNNMEIKCPHCNSYLDAWSDYGDWEGDTLTEHMEGECPDCGAKFKWVETYKCAEVKEFREV